MDDTERLREIAALIIKDSNEEGRIKYAAELLKLASEIENQRAGSSKLLTEEQKLSFDLRESQSRQKSDDRKAYITLLAPVFTTFVLAGTLILQSYQFVQSERDKQIEVRQQTDAAEDVRWTDAVKLLSQSDKVSPAGVLLKSFVKSDRYGAQAHQTALQILLKTEDPVLFENLFALVFEPVDWNDLPQIIGLNRTMYVNIGPLAEKSYDAKKRMNDLNRLNPLERRKYDSLIAEIEFTATKIAPLLKGRRPGGVALDLHGTDILLCDLQYADLSGANLDGVNVSSVNLKGADLSRISHAELSMFLTAWWEASQMSQETLQYLMKEYPFQAGVQYGPSYRTISQKDYDENVARLLRLASGR